MGEQRTAFVLLLILCFTIVAISEIGIVQAQNTIYIRADGSVEGTDKIQRDGEVYTLISDISDSIVVERDNVVLNGAGYTLQGDGNENGITLNDVNNITVKRLKLTNFNIGIVVMGSNDNRFLENTITDNFRGLDLTASRNNTIFGSYIANNTYGIALENQDNIINNNTIANNSDAGIFLYGAGYNIIFGNNLTDNNNGVYLSISSYNGIFENNITDKNDWNITIVGKGNFWSNYNGTDNDGDGFGDIPYVIDENNQDNYPLMNKFIIPEFPSWIILPLLIIATLVVAIIRDKLIREG
jgi:parallel beta-helix repeat protein